MNNFFKTGSRYIAAIFLSVLLVSCGGDSQPSISTNTPPVASAGSIQNVMTGTLVTLDGSASFDANSDPLTYSWKLASKPTSSTAALTDSTTSAPTLIADLAGTYVATLVVNDGTVDSAAATVTITAAVGNVAPVADAGTAQNVTTGTVVTLDGSASSDANTDPLTYSWTLTSKPASSAAALIGATSAAPTLTADLAGTYVATLVVNDGQVNSIAVTVTITATVANAAPVADAGSAQNVTTGTLVTLNGSASSDANSDPLTYSWTLTSKPASSAATLTGATSAAPTLTADLAGTYVATLVVNDGTVNSTAATVTITATVANAAPVADAGSAQNVTTGTLATLDGSASSDANSDPLTYSWTLTSKPASSAATLTGATSSAPTLTADLAGTYVATLVVNDGTVNSTAATVTITATTIAVTSTLNDTGITASQCYGAGSDALVACSDAGASALNPAQDGMAGRDANAATNGNTDGKLGLSFSAVTGGCVQDNITGLMWEVKTTDGGLRDWTKTYTNYSATYDPSLLYGTATDASGFVSAVNATNLCGYSDWRLPTADELQSIVDYGVAYPGPTIDTSWFPNTQGNVFWSASPYVVVSGAAWAVSFYGGYVSYNNVRNGTNYVRLVRAGQ